jgi:hypothetical protein
MAEERNDSGKNKTEIAQEEPSKKVAVPLGATIENLIKALQILGDNGGKGRFNELSPMFGDKKSDKTLFSFSLNAAVAFGLINPHKGKSPYLISDDGKRFLSSEDDEQRKAILFPKFLNYEGYRKILIGMKNAKDKSMKKQTITNTWMSIAGGKGSTRRLYTTTFASIGNWVGAITDSGQTCVLSEEGEETLSQILRGEEIKPGTQPVTVAQPMKEPTLSKSSTEVVSEMVQCPICNKSNLITSDRYLDKVPTRGGTLLIIERTFQCQGCSNKFTRIAKELVPSPD